MIKNKFTIIGNCQIDSILKFLMLSPKFSSAYEYIRVPPVHTIPTNIQDTYLDKIKSLDLVIQQPIVDVKRFPYLTNSVINKTLSESCKIINIPSAYYSGYFPTYESLDGVTGAIGGIHNYQLIDCFLKGVSESGAVEIINNLTGLTSQQIENQHFSSIQNLHRREIENKLDVKLSAFIIENFQSKRLFYTFNHPTGETVKYIAEQILKLCDIDDKVICNDTDLLNHIILPVNPKISAILGLKFSQIEIIKDKTIIELDEQVSLDYKTYSGLDIKFLKRMIVNKKNFLNNI
ncbi:WcbI family polysaccharide biosynthesis putative acetyltransferase [Psychromonas sp. SA13A]|uniref:WcbI family polysaccharide biosynthesis putative acetyltransferase n=1 Tax=Psychromonas sp. SA13A TaxID=2686346 RepID=UPI00140D03F1|nr:WcbI family polysaccharide biosynthesis putative acetyltransferase [Psychromonas sp. SA13A]